jgi:hypothetical protein
MSTNINFVNSEGLESDTRIDFNLPRTILLKSQGRAVADGAVIEGELCAYNALNALSKIIVPTFAADPATLAYLAATGITGATEVAAINNLVVGLKTDGLWSKMKAVYPFVTDIKNMFGFSNDFANAAWVKFPSTVVANSIPNPIDGSLNASTLNFAGGLFYNSGGNTGATSGTFSGYVKNNGAQFIQIYDSSNGYVNFDIINYSVTFSDTMTGTITPLANGWCKITVTKPTQYFVNNIFLSVTSSGTSGRDSNKISGSLYLYAFQVEIGLVATSYQNNVGSAQTAISNQFKYNLKDPRDLDAAFRLVFNGGWTHSSTGATPNGTNGFANTYLVPNTQLSAHSIHLSYYSRTQNTTQQDAQIGSSNVGYSNQYTIDLYYAGAVNAKVFVAGSYPGNSISNPNTDTLGYMIGTRTANNVAKMFMDGSQIGSTLTTTYAGGFSTSSIYIGAQNNDGTALEFGSKQCAFASIGDGLLDAEATALYNRVQNFQTALSRNV